MAFRWARRTLTRRFCDRVPLVATRGANPRCTSHLQNDAVAAALLAGCFAWGVQMSSCEETSGRDVKRWHERWGTNQTNWHLKEVNPYLLRFLEELLPNCNLAERGTTTDSRVLVPLCGKTVDMAYLASRGCRVVGFDAVPKALEEFALENSSTGKTVELELKDIDRKRFRAHSVAVRGDGSSTPPPVLLFEGDFLSISAAEAEAFVPFGAAFDRGGFVAVEPKDRADYARVLADMISPDGRILMVAVEHDPFSGGRLGPPYEVTGADLTHFFSANFDVRLLLREDRFEADEGMRARGCTRFHECIYLLTRRRH